jgi:hypothetical protein
MSSNVNSRSMNGIIEFDDGNGGLLSGGNLTSQDANITNGALIGGTSSIHKLDIADVLTLDGTLNVNSVPITPVWLSYLQDCSSNIQNQINAIVASAYVVLNNNNTWTGTNVFDNTVTLDATTRCNESLVFKGGEGTYFRNMADTAGASLFYDETRGFWNNVIGSSKLTYSVGQADKMLISSSGVNMVSPVTFSDTASGLHATSIANGTISDSEYETLNGITGNIQLQLESKQPQVNELFPVSASAIGDVSYTSTDPVTNTEYSYLRGVTSAIQTQINAITSSISSLVSTLLASVNTWSKLNIFNASIRFPVNSKIELQGSSATTTVVPIASSAYIYCLGGTLYNNALAFVNAFSNDSTDEYAFIFWKRSLFGDRLLAGFTNAGELIVGDRIDSRIMSTTCMTQTANTTYTQWTLPGVIVVTTTSDVKLPISAKSGTRTIIICKGSSSYIRSNNASIPQIYYAGSAQTFFLLNGGSTQLVYDGTVWVLY